MSDLEREGQRLPPATAPLPYLPGTRRPAPLHEFVALECPRESVGWVDGVRPAPQAPDAEPGRPADRPRFGRGWRFAAATGP
jgi:hypothetical protein